MSIVHKLVIFSNQPEALLTTGYELVMGAFYVFGVMVYVARVQERWKPGKFDLAGHSHQLFHVLVIAGACTHYLGGLVYLKVEKDDRVLFGLLGFFLKQNTMEVNNM